MQLLLLLHDLISSGGIPPSCECPSSFCGEGKPEPEKCQTDKPNNGVWSCGDGGDGGDGGTGTRDQDGDGSDVERTCGA